MNPAPIRVETDASLRSREAVLDVLQEMPWTKDVPSIRQADERIAEVSLDELAEYVSEVVRDGTATRICG